jgi:hypothetical protein
MAAPFTAFAPRNEVVGLRQSRAAARTTEEPRIAIDEVRGTLGSTSGGDSFHDRVSRSAFGNTNEMRAIVKQTSPCRCGSVCQY